MSLDERSRTRDTKRWRITYYGIVYRRGDGTLGGATRSRSDSRHSARCRSRLSPISVCAVQWHVARRIERVSQFDRINYRILRISESSRRPNRTTVSVKHDDRTDPAPRHQSLHNSQVSHLFRLPVAWGARSVVVPYHGSATSHAAVQALPSSRTAGAEGGQRSGSAVGLDAERACHPQHGPSPPGLLQLHVALRQQRSPSASSRASRHQRARGPRRGSSPSRAT